MSELFLDFWSILELELELYVHNSRVVGHATRVHTARCSNILYYTAIQRKKKKTKSLFMLFGSTGMMTQHVVENKIYVRNRIRCTFYPSYYDTFWIYFTTSHLPFTWDRNLPFFKHFFLSFRTVI